MSRTVSLHNLQHDEGGNYMEEEEEEEPASFCDSGYRDDKSVSVTI